MRKSLILMAGVVFLLTSSLTARDLRHEERDIKSTKSFKLSQEDIPFPQQRVHRVGLLQLCMTNWGVLGSQMRDLSMWESEGGCFTPNPYEEFESPSAEYPAGSNLEYLFQGGLWIGAMVGGKPYTSIACDGWYGIYELWPDAEPYGAIVEKTTRANSFCYSPDAISEQDIIAVYTDSSANIPLSQTQRDPWDRRKHAPLYIEVTQRSYAWSFEYAEDFVLIDYTIKNMWTQEEGRPPEPPKIHEDDEGKIKDIYVGLYIDADCQHADEDGYGAYGAQDDLCGFRGLVTSPKPEAERDCDDTVNIAWIADNDGHGDFDGGENAGVFSSKSPIAVTGVRVVRSPQHIKYSFNYWISHQMGAPNDWGPWTAENQKKWASMNPYGSGNTFPDNVLGTPGGDVSKYFVMSNGEFDYDQVYACVGPDKYPEKGWLPANKKVCDNLANGFDTRYLLSFGPFDELGPGDSLKVTIAYVAGNNFHVDPRNLYKDQNMDHPDKFYANLDFTDFETNAIWAAKVYDNPEPDFPCGDGIPDFKGPPPPPSPELSFHTESGKVRIMWNGKATETTRDNFNGRLDFEGYEIWISRTGLTDDYARLCSYDKKDNHNIYWLNKAKRPPEWVWVAASVSWDSLVCWLKGKGTPPYDDPDDTTYTKEYPAQETLFLNLSDSLDPDGVPVVYNSIKLAPGDFIYFEPRGDNLGFDSIIVNHAYRESVDLGLVTDTADRYWDYEYGIEVFSGEPSYFSVTAFDVGDPQTELPPLHSSKLVNATSIYAIPEWEEVKEKGLGVRVYPNPYRTDENYYPEYEKEGSGNFDKRLRFVNLPPQCTIRIYTLDGDLVRTLEHNTREEEKNRTYHYWDLVTRNTQAVVSGLYLFTVEDKKTGETQIGKFVIIK